MPDDSAFGLNNAGLKPFRKPFLSCHRFSHFDNPAKRMMTRKHYDTGWFDFSYCVPVRSEDHHHHGRSPSSSPWIVLGHVVVGSVLRHCIHHPFDLSRVVIAATEQAMLRQWPNLAVSSRALEVLHWGGNCWANFDYCWDSTSGHVVINARWKQAVNAVSNACKD